MAADHLVRKLRAFGPLPQASTDALGALGDRRTRTVPAGQDLISEGDDPRDIYLITDGWACRYKMLDTGARQIVGLFIPGDLCDLHVYVLDRLDHSIGAITPVTVARISQAEMDALCDAHPRVVRAFWWDSLVQSSIQHEWMLSVGQRTALESLANLLCELFLRLRTIGEADGDRCAVPLTHAQFGDILGLTETHVGRTIKRLNAGGCATLKRRTLVIHDLAGLKTLARFNDLYLHRAGGTLP